MNLAVLPCGSLSLKDFVSPYAGRRPGFDPVPDKTHILMQMQAGDLGFIPMPVPEKRASSKSSKKREVVLVQYP